MKIRFLFHKPLGERGIGKLIVAWTWLLGLFYNWKVLKYNFSHEEVWIPDNSGLNCHSWKAGTDYMGQCFSSTTRGGADGVRFATACKVLHHPERWDYIEAEVDPERLEVALEEALKLVDKQYDFLGIFGFINPLPVHHKNRWYCSEICDWFKVLLRVHPKRHMRISPRRSAYKLAKRYGEPKSLV